MECSILREKYYEWLHNFLGLDPWHAVPNTERPFGFHVLKKLNSLLRKTGKENLIVEIGCGLGDIISSLDYPNSKKHGYDLNPKVVWGGRGWLTLLEIFMWEHTTRFAEKE